MRDLQADAVANTNDQSVPSRVTTADYGPWNAPEHDSRRVLLLLEGAMLRTLAFAETSAAELLGPGDLLHLQDGEADFEHSVRWTVLRPVRIATVPLDGQAPKETWERILPRLLAGADEQGRRLSFLNAIGHMPRVEGRVLALLWQVSNRWGRVTSRGIEIDIELTHQVIGTLVGARRPTVSIAIRRLREAGAVERTDGGVWILHPESADRLSTV